MLKEKKGLKTIYEVQVTVCGKLLGAKYLQTTRISLFKGEIKTAGSLN